METQIDRFPVRDLGDRYKGQSGQPLQKSAMYDRLNALGLKPEKTTKGSFVNADQLALLDELHQFISSGGKMADFSFQGKTEEKPTNKEMRNEFGGGVENAIAPLTMATAKGEIGLALSEIANAITFSREQDPLIVEEVAFRKLRMLEEAATMGWRLPTSLVKQLLGRSTLPRTIDGWFVYGSFRFLETGKIGNQYQWKVTKYQK